MSETVKAFKRNSDLTANVQYLVLAGIIVFSVFARDLMPENRLIVQQLEYKHGRFHQLVVPSSGDTIHGKWSASIRDMDNAYECSGGDDAPYSAKSAPLTMTPDQWTGGTCNLKVGQRYIGTAVWEWSGPDGSTRRMSAEIEFTYTGT